MVWKQKEQTSGWNPGKDLYIVPASCQVPGWPIDCSSHATALLWLEPSQVAWDSGLYLKPWCAALSGCQVLAWGSPLPLSPLWNRKWAFWQIHASYLAEATAQEAWEVRGKNYQLKRAGCGFRERGQTYLFQVWMRTSCFFMLCSRDFSSIQSLSLWLKTLPFSSNIRVFLVIRKRNKTLVEVMNANYLKWESLWVWTWKIWNSKPHALTWPYSIKHSKEQLAKSWKK